MFFYVTKAWQSSITYENSRSSLIVALFTTYLRECANMTFNLHKTKLGILVISIMMLTEILNYYTDL